LTEDGLRAGGRADAADELIDAPGIGDAPADVGVERQCAVDGVALGIARQQFRTRQVEILQTAIEALHRLDRPRPFEVQPGLFVVAAVERLQVLAELRQVNVLGAVHGESAHRRDDGRRYQNEREQKFPVHDEISFVCRLATLRRSVGASDASAKRR